MSKLKLALLSSAIGALLVTQPVPTAAQDGAADTARRVDRLERELRAVQRRVFPGSDGTMFQPEIQPEAPATPGAAPVATPLVDLTARVDSLESQVARLTGQVEQQGFRMQEMQTALTRLQGEVAAARAAAAPAPAPGVTPAPGPSATPTPAPRPAANAAATPRPTPTPTPSPRPTATPAPTAVPRPTGTAATPAATAARRARVEAIEVPATGNAPEDDYLYGYRLWEARLFPEAQAQLQRVIERHPNHRRASYAGNLLGRAYLDNNQATLAVGAFHDNYRTRPRGERAGDSLYFMGMALIRLNRRTDACRTFDEFDRMYGETARQELRTMVTAGRAEARC